MAKAPRIKLVRLRGRNQITLPASVIEALSLEEGDYLAVVLSEEGIIRLRPAKMVTAGTLEAKRAMGRAEADLGAGRSTEFDSVREFTNEMLASHRERMKETEAEPTEVGRAELRGALAEAQGYRVGAWTTMLVHVGTVSTSASIQRDGVPIFTRNIELGSKTATAQQLAEEVRRTVEFFQTAIEGSSVGTVFLSVGPPPMTGLASELERALRLRVRELSAAEEVARAARPIGWSSKAAGFNQSINIEKFSFPHKLKTSE